MHLPNTLISFLTLLLPYRTLSTPLPLSPQTALPNSNLHTPTRYESTLLARRLLALSTTGVLSTIFPSSNSSNPSRLPIGLDGVPIGLPDYLSLCESTSHPTDPTLLALSVSTSTRNALAGSNVSLSLSWWETYTIITGRKPWSPANLPRMSLLGYLEQISETDVERENIVGCYLRSHGDARLWLPGDRKAAHVGLWMRLVVREVYWIGGFGDRNYIGWLEGEEWRRVKEGEWEGVRLPGEKD